MASRGRKEEKISKQKFTIVLTNYNNEQFIEKSLVSVFNQTYDNIELIITDDASEKFNKNMVEKIFEKYLPKNITQIKYIINKENLGTVKTVNKALELVDGEYVLFFATDDALASKDVIQNYVDIFNDKSINVVTTNWVLCDENLKIKKKYQNPKFLKKFNNKSVKKQYAQLCKTNIYGAGSTCYRKSIFEKYGSFDESFKYLEDWPLWLKLTLNNERIYYSNFDGLLHRDGGISHDKSTNSVRSEFFKEILNLYRNNILKNINHLSESSKIKIINSYLFSIDFYSKYFDTSEYYEDAINFINSNKKIKFCFFLSVIYPRYFSRLKVLLKLNNSVPIAFIITVISMFILINIVKFNNKNLFLLFIILLYIIVYYITCTILTMLLSKRGK